ncbi:arginine--tRNA ligase [Paenibacillus donghaensis]|uniref:arginine--tRNA ligase n=1 Tax=Paenibacillus donghaensis TaxID=414771 RepID=A0A2Z2KD32_9BACL|nr:arginine--tRNA ligase [Paenibacillus donghaensis]ASA23834.1 arginine--tRNA ligase [Paenibacillus donghaensis]
MISEVIRASLQKSISSVCSSLGMEWDGEWSGVIPLEQPAHAEHGDYSSSLAMQLAKRLRKPPIVIAGLVKAEMEQQGCCGGLLSRVEVAAPGFVNLYVDWREWAVRSFDYPAVAQGKIAIEHTSVNPNKSMHVGHLRNACIGDALARLLRTTGNEVEVHNYVDDLGNQLADTVVGLLHVPLEGEHIRFGDYCWDVYASVNREYAQQPEMTAKRTEMLHALEQGKGNEAWLGNLTAERIVREHVEEMHSFGIDYDLLVWESSIVRGGFWNATFQLLQQTPVFVKETAGKLAGCWVLKVSGGDGEQTEEQSEEHHQDKVLVRSNGILTYTAKDIAYHLWKFGLLEQDFLYKPFTSGVSTTSPAGQQQPYGQARSVINVIDYRQEYPQAMVKQALEVLGYAEQADQLHHVSYGVVSLSPASADELGLDTSDLRSSYAMSGRQGIGVKVSELLQRMETVIENARPDSSGLTSREIATAAIRYYLLRFNLGTEIVFDFKQATEISGNTGVYLMYTFARASSVLSKAQLPIPADAALLAFPALPEPAENGLLRQLAAWQDTLYTASQELTPNTICSYAHTLATLFNNFYGACPILKGEPATILFRLWLTSRFRDTFGEVLEVLGLPAPERL